MRFKSWIVLIMALYFSLINVGMAQTQDESYEPDAPGTVGISAYWGGDYELALTALNVAVAQNPDNAEALAYRGALYERRGELDLAEADYEQSLSLTPTSEEDLFSEKPTLVDVLKADIDIDRGRIIEPAVTGFDLTRTEPDNPLGYYLTGRALLLDPQTDPASTLPYFNDAIEYDTKLYTGLTASIYANRADAYRRLKRYEDALEDVEIALESYSDHHLALRVKGHIFLEQGNYESAIQYFSRLLRFYPDDLYALALRGNVYFSIEEYDLSLLDLNAAIIHNENYGFALNLRAQIYLMRGEHQKAVDDLNIVLEIDPNYAYGYAMRGEAYGWLGDFDQSLEDLNRSIELYPEGAYAWMSRGITYASMRKYDLAFKNLNEAVRLDPQYRNAHYARMRIALSQGQFITALIDFISIVGIDMKSS
jgi:tetratricopeptide (TPR) repeat protein